MLSEVSSTAYRLDIFALANGETYLISSSMLNFKMNNNRRNYRYQQSKKAKYKKSPTYIQLQLEYMV
jgi:hypothetical protein